MTQPASPDLGALGIGVGAPLSSRVPRFDFGRLARHRKTILGYCQVLAGTFGRMAVQLVYFVVLANTLPLSGMGVFASVSAAGIMLGSMTGLGFQSFVFRSATSRPAVLGSYLGLYYLCCLAWLPAAAAIAAGLYVALFHGSIGVLGYAAIVLAEVVAWRIIEMLIQVNNGLGRYGAAATVVTASTGLRALAAVAFWLGGGGGADTWALYYLGGNAVAVTGLAMLFHPRVRLRWHPVLLRGRLLDSLLYAVSYFFFLAQNEVDKIIILTFTGNRVAGIYAIAMRIVDMTAVPLRPIFVLYSRKLIKAGRATRETVLDCLKVEGAVALVSTLGLGGLVAVLTIWPRLLGSNVSTAVGMMAAILFVPAIRNLLEFHSELFFAFNRMAVRSVVAATMVIAKALALALLLRHFGSDDESWGAWLNVVYGAIYVFSFVAIYGLLQRAARLRQPGAAS